MAIVTFDPGDNEARGGLFPRRKEAHLAEILTPDLCVIGAGSGGLAVAEAARAHDASVVIVEKGRLGGNALHIGATPARALAAAADHAQALREAPLFGISAEELKVNFRKVHDHVNAVIAALSPAQAAPRFEALGATILAAEGRFVDKRTLVAGDTLVRARHFVIATGGRAEVPAIPGLDAVPFFTTDTILDNTRKLTHLVVVGGGPLALQLAQSYRRLGSEVTVVEAGLFLPDADPELAAVVLKRLAEEGVRLLPSSSVAAIQARSMGIGVSVNAPDGEVALDASQILVATGRWPMLDGLDLDKAGIRRSKADPTHLQLNRAGRTSNPAVFAIGEAAGTDMVHAARRQAAQVVRSALFGLPAASDPLAVPRVLHTDPELAEVGLSERAARTRHGLGFRVTRLSFADNDRARAARTPYGVVKLITTRSGRLLGAGIAGPGAAELGALFALALASGTTVAQLATLAAPYGSYAEIVNRLADLAVTQAPNPILTRLLSLRRLLG